MKKAQAALEFLMTYGWAIIMVLIAIGALAYFGVIPTKQSKTLGFCNMNPQNCICEEYKGGFVATDGHYDPTLKTEEGKSIPCIKLREKTQADLDLEYCYQNFLDEEKCICEEPVLGYTQLRVQRNDNGRFLTFESNRPATLGNISNNFMDIYNVSIWDTTLINRTTEIIGCERTIVK